MKQYNNQKVEQIKTAVMRLIRAFCNKGGGKMLKLGGWLIMLVMLALSCIRSGESFVNVKDFGVRGEKNQKVTRQLQRAIDRCHEKGGGRVYFPPGEYLAGTLVLKDNVTLYLEAGAILYASQDTNDYINDFIVLKKDDSGKSGDGATPVFIYAKGARNIGIQGKGTIHGQALRTYEDLKQVDGFIAQETKKAQEAGVEMKMYYKVPPFVCLVFLEDCEQVTIRDVSLIESTDWTLHFKWCRRVYVDHVYLESSLEAGVNSDGIDIDGCSDVVVSNCIITTGDDAIVLKSTMTYPEYRNCENVTVTNCVLTSTSTALKIGTESYGDFRHITFNNCVIRNSNRGLSIVVRDGGTVENISFSDITMETDRKHFNWWGNGDPIWLVVKKRFPDSKIGTIRHVTFSNIIAHSQGTSKIEGYQGYPLENIRLNNVQIHMYPEDFPDKRADDAFNASNINGLSLRDVYVTWNGQPEPAWRHAFSFKEVSRLYLEGLQGSVPPSGSGAFIELEAVKGAVIERCWPMEGTSIFLQLSGPDNLSVQAGRNYLDTKIQKVKTLRGGKLQAVSGL